MSFIVDFIAFLLSKFYNIFIIIIKIIMIQFSISLGPVKVC